MFDNVKSAITAAESIFSDLSYNIDSCKTDLDYWKDRLATVKAETPDEDTTYIDNYIKRYSIQMEMYTAMQDTVKAIVANYIKKF